MSERPHSRRPAGEVYTQQDHPAFEEFMAARTASHDAAFFLPHLRPGMRVLDAGCGPGSITIGLAQAVHPGEVIGVDLQATQVERARGLAAARGVGNVRFEAADLYGLPFPDRTFDAVFSHGVVMHLREPLRAIAEMRRVLARGGIVGLRDPYVAAGFISPSTPLIEQSRALLIRVREHNGSHPLVGAVSRVAPGGRLRRVRGHRFSRICRLAGGDAPLRRVAEDAAAGPRPHGTHAGLGGPGDNRRNRGRTRGVGRAP